MSTGASTALDPDALAELASKALETGEEAQAIPVVQAAAERLRDPTLWQWTALLQRSLDQHEAALASFEDGKLFVRTGDDVWTRLYPSSETEFFAARNATQWQFVNGEMVTRTGSMEVRRRRVR